MSDNPKNASSGGDDASTANRSPQTTSKASGKRTGNQRSGGSNRSKSRSASTADPLKDRRDESGGLIDPPVIPEYEQRLRAAHDAADDAEIAAITEEYHKAREERAKELLKREEANK